MQKSLQLSAEGGKPQPRPTGGQTLYRPSFCQKVIELGKEGKTNSQVAAELGVCRSTLHKWTQDFPDFSDAYRLSREFAEKWWLNIGQEYMLKGGKDSTFNDRIWIFWMKARFGLRDSDPTTTNVTQQVQQNTTVTEATKNLVENDSNAEEYLEAQYKKVDPFA